MTLKEIGDKANVSVSTVSLVLNNKKGVSAKRRSVILKLLEELYDPKLNSADSHSGKLIFIKYSRTGKLIEENEGFVSVILDALGNECRREGYQLIYQYCHKDFKKSIENIDFSDIDGVFLLGTELIPEDYKDVSLIEKPLIVIDNSLPEYHFNTITMANYEMVKTGFNYLYSNNPNMEFGFLIGTEYAENFEERLKSVEIEAFHHGLSLDSKNLIKLDPTLDGSRDDLTKLLKEGFKLPPILFAANDTIGIGAIHAMTNCGIKVPEDVQIIGFDDIVFSKSVQPSLTTLSVKRRLIGSVAVNLMEKTINDKNFRDIKVRIGGSLIIRDSTKK
jgi:LacI family transcriptional regulator